MWPKIGFGEKRLHVSVLVVIGIGIKRLDNIGKESILDIPNDDNNNSVNILRQWEYILDLFFAKPCKDE